MADIEDDFTRILEDLNAPDPDVRAAAITLIGQYGALYDDEGRSSSAVPQVSQALADDGSRAVRWSAAYALGAIGEAAGLPALIGALRRAEADGDIGLQMVIIKALGKIGGGEAIATLTFVLEQAELPCLRMSARRALTRMETPEAQAGCQ